MRYERAQEDLETTNRVRRAVARRARLPAPLSVEAAVSAVMCTLTERLTAGEAHELLAVPAPVSALFEHCVLHRDARPTSRMDRAELVAKVADHLGVTPAHAELIAGAVFSAVRAELPADVVASVTNQLPRGLQELWLGPVSAPDLDVDIPPEGVRRAVEIDLERRAKLPPHVTPAAAFSAVMCTLARRLSGGEVRHLLLGLPSGLRDLVAECAEQRTENAQVFGRDELLDRVSEHLETDAAATQRIVSEVFRAAKRVLPQQTIAEIDSQLPVDLLEVWRSALPPHES